MSIVRNNLLTDPNYTPYCGSERCPSRTEFNGIQFHCPECGWFSDYSKDFMEKVITFKSIHNIHISVLRGFLHASGVLSKEEVASTLNTPLSAFGGFSAAQYILKQPDSHFVFDDVLSVFRRMFRFTQKSPNLDVLAEWYHKSWSGWMQYLFSKTHLDIEGNAVIPKEFVDRWFRQMTTIYKDLPEKEKESDKKDAQQMISFLLENDIPNISDIISNYRELDFLPCLNPNREKEKAPNYTDEIFELVLTKFADNLNDFFHHNRMEDSDLGEDTLKYCLKKNPHLQNILKEMLTERLEKLS